MDKFTGSCDYLWIVHMLITMGMLEQEASRDTSWVCAFRLHGRLIGCVTHWYSLWCSEAFFLCAGTDYMHWRWWSCWFCWHFRVLKHGYICCINVKVCKIRNIRASPTASALANSWSWLELSLSNISSSFWWLLKEANPAATLLPKPCHVNLVLTLGPLPVMGNRQYFRGRQKSHIVGSMICRENNILPGKLCD